jgi:hypothetical protein
MSLNPEDEQFGDDGEQGTPKFALPPRELKAVPLEATPERVAELNRRGTVVANILNELVRQDELAGFTPEQIKIRHKAQYYQALALQTLNPNACITIIDPLENLEMPKNNETLVDIANSQAVNLETIEVKPEIIRLESGELVQVLRLSNGQIIPLNQRGGINQTTGNPQIISVPAEKEEEEGYSWKKIALGVVGLAIVGGALYYGYKQISGNSEAVGDVAMALAEV